MAWRSASATTSQDRRSSNPAPPVRRPAEPVARRLLLTACASDAMASDPLSNGPTPDLSFEAEARDPSPADEREAMEQLRQLLVGPEQATLDALQDRLDALDDEDEHLQRVSRVLPDAVAIGAAQDDRLARALEPTIERTLKRSVERDPSPLVDALFPVIGPAIRKGIREALSQLLASINLTLEHSLSPRSLRWRFEAWQTAQTFAEIVLRNTLKYRVEQLFLIDRATGLPLAHVHDAAVEVQDTALVSGMMTAIQDFVHDSFGDASGGGSLETLQVGELVVLIEPGPKAVLAAVLRGQPSPALREALRDLNETLHLRMRRELDAFDGDTGPFEKVGPLLEQGLLTQYIEGDTHPRLSPAFWIVLGLVVLLAGAWIVVGVRDRQRWDAFVARVDAEPGVVVLDDGRAGGRRVVRGLRDPLAAEPAALLAAAGLDSTDVRVVWEPYQSLDTAIVARRAARLLAAPPTVSLHVEDGVLVATGSASADWRAQARARAPLLGGVDRYDGSALVGARLQALVDRLERQALRFQLGTARLLPGQDAAVDSLAVLVADVLETATESGGTPRIRVVGHASREGADAVNQRLSEQRAAATVALLAARGLPADALVPDGTGQPRSDRAGDDDATRAFNRSTGFHLLAAADR